MRILFCTNSLGAKGGIEKVTIVKANAFADIDGNQVAVCFTDKGSYPEDTIHPVSPKLKIYDLGVPFWDLYPLGIKNLLWRAPKKFFQLRRAIKRIILDFKPDIVITTGSYEKYALASINPKSLLNKPCAKVREYHFNSNYREFLPSKPPFSALIEAFEYRVLGKMFDMNYLLTKEDRNANFKSCKRFDYQHNPVLFPSLERIPISRRDKSVIVVSRLAYQKNVSDIIKAWAIVHEKEKEWKLQIVGQGPQRRQLERLAVSLGIEESVSFLGFKNNVHTLLCKSRILAATSLYEGFYMSIVEAMSCGTVPISYRTPYGPADIITTGENGILVNYMDKEALADKLLELMHSEETLERMSEAAFRRAFDFHIDKVAHAWMSKYRALLGLETEHKAAGKRILFCTNSLGAKGGIEKVTIVKANAFADIEGNQVAVCFTDKGSYPEDTIHPVSPKLKIYDLGVPFWNLYPLGIKNLLWRAPKKFFQLRRAIKRVIRDFKPDIVITTGSYEKYALATIRPKSLLKKPCAKVREYHFNSNYRKFVPSKPPFSALIEAFEYRVLDNMFDMNYLLTKEDRETNFKGRKHFDYQHNPVSFPLLERIPIAKRDKTVIVVCRLAHEKNVKAIINIWAKVCKKESDWLLQVVGHGPQRSELEHLAVSLGIGDRVSFLGFKNNVSDLLRRSRILAATSLYEGFGMSIVEAMSCGTVPISYRTPYGPADIISDGINGALVGYMDEVGFANRLLSLMQSEEVLERMSAEAYLRSDDFSVEKIVKAWMQKYNMLLDNHYEANY